jgi:hypothetical protein
VYIGAVDGRWKPPDTTGILEFRSGTGGEETRWNEFSWGTSTDPSGGVLRRRARVRLLLSLPVERERRNDDNDDEPRQGPRTVR